MEFQIKGVSTDKKEEIQNAIDMKTKPLGSLGKLEEIALRIGMIQGTTTPVISKPAIVVFAGDHGIAAEGVSPYPQAVTFQMVLNFLAGGAAINVFARQNDILLKVVDAGVNGDFEADENLINLKVARSTRNFLREPAMTADQLEDALTKASDLVARLGAEGTNTIGFGEMGIANTSAASVIMHLLGGIPLEECVGSGTGLDDEGVRRKLDVLTRAAVAHDIRDDPAEILATFGGFEIAMICGGMLKAAQLGMLILVDGFIVTSALLVAARMHPEVLDYCLFTHQSAERGHRRLVECLEGSPLLHLDMRLGEGTGAAVALPIIRSAVNFLNEMATFDSANVSSSETND